MFRKSVLSIVLFINTFLLTLVPLAAQEEEGEIIIISERVGKEIDQAEREKFKLFEGVTGFQSAVYIKLPDGRYFLKITYLDENTGELKIKRIQQSEVSIKNRGNYIDNFEEIQARREDEERGGEIIIVSKRVGKEIDREERDKYKLFQDVKGFQSAIFIKLPDNRYILKIIYQEEQTSDLKVDRIQQSEESINNIRDSIDHFGKTQAHADSSKKTFCISLGFGKPIYEGGPQRFGGSSHWLMSLRFLKFPIAFMISIGDDWAEEETNGMYRRFLYETYNILYMIPLSKSKRTDVFVGGGIGSIWINEKGSDNMDYNGQEYTIYNFEVGCKARLGFLGSYAKVKHFYAKGTKNCILFILGLDLNFYL